MPYLLQKGLPKSKSQRSRLTTSKSCLNFVLPKVRFVKTSYDVKAPLPLVPRRILRASALAFGRMPIARMKSGDMASSSEPESQHVYASTPLILINAGSPCRWSGVFPTLSGLTDRTFELEAQLLVESTLTCRLVLPVGQYLMPLPRTS